MTRLFLVRHGETQLNKEKMYYGWTDCQLSNKGYKQSLKLNQILKNIKFDVVITSPLKRALDTAKIITNKRLDEMIVDNRLKEMNFGEWEGKTMETIMATDNEQWEKWCHDWKHEKPTNGESYIDLYDRVTQCIDELISKYKNKTLLLVSHQGCLKIILIHLLKLSKDCYWNFTFEQGKYSMCELMDGHCTVKKINCEVI